MQPFYSQSRVRARLLNCGAEEVRRFASAARVGQTVPDTSAVQQRGSLSLCVCVGDSRVSKSLCYWQLSPSPWAGEVACCVGRGYTCSGPVRPRYRYISHLRPAPSCRSASLPLGLGTEPTETQGHIYVRQAGCFCLLFIRGGATKQAFQNAWEQTGYFILPACINRIW